ncbi:MAG: aminotransferase class V-fold PLP-dependent enzyme [Thermoanaerobaculia bacterium]
MSIDRRRLLAIAVAGAAASVLPRGEPASAAAGSVSAASRPGALFGADGNPDWTSVRGEFELDPDWIHLGSFFLASNPRVVRDAMARYRREIDANPLSIDRLFQPAHTDDNRATRTRLALASYLGGRRDEIALSPNTTTGLALLYNGLRIRTDQEILVTEHDHYVHHEAVRYAAERSGAAVRFVALHEGSATASAAAMVDRLRQAIAPRTRVVGLTWVHSSTGLKLPIAELAAVVMQANTGRSEADRCLLIVDGVHGFGVEDVDAARLGADFFVASAHKWLLAPRGTGVIWGRAESWPAIRPTIPNFDPDGGAAYGAWKERAPLPATRAAFISPGGFIAYENQFAVADAIAFHRELGRARITARIHELNAQIRQGLAAIKGVTLHTPVDGSLAAGIACFEVAGMKPEAVVERLAVRRIHATTSPYKVSYARLAAGIMNSPGEIDTALAAVRDLAGA